MELFSDKQTQTKTHKQTKQGSKKTSYSAHDIEVLEGIDPVRRRPGMYIGGTDEKAMYHLIVEVLDNAMDEAIAGFASQITVHMSTSDTIIISDNGRGIPIERHPKFPNKSALEVILTTLHSGGKFSNKVYDTAGGLHGVGVSVVNALSEKFVAEIKRNKKCYRQEYVKGKPLSDIVDTGISCKDHGTKITFKPDTEIFGKAAYTPKEVYRMICSKAYLYKGVEIHWSCDPGLIREEDNTPKEAIIHFPDGLKDYLNSMFDTTQLISPDSFAMEVELPDQQGKIEWAINWSSVGESFNRSYCNTIYTPLGGTHELGMRNALLKGLKNYAELSNNKRVGQVITEDITNCTITIISVFIKNPIFQGQTKEKLLNQDITKVIEGVMRNHFEHWLTAKPKVADIILELIINESEERLKRKKEKEVNRKTPIKSLRLPGKLADCSQESSEGTELFIVEGDSAGGSAKQARNREKQAILPLKGKILNVASSSIDKIKSNQEISNLILAMGCGVEPHYKQEELRYEKIIIMTDADVDGAHITSLLLTFFYLQMPNLIRNGHLYLAQPPLYKITQGANNYYAQNDQDKTTVIEKLPKNKGHIEVSRFKGLGEMTAAQLKETTMDPKKRVLLRVIIEEVTGNETNTTSQIVEKLMGKNPEMRFKFIKENTENYLGKLDNLIDV